MFTASTADKENVTALNCTEKFQLDIRNSSVAIWISKTGIYSLQNPGNGISMVFNIKLNIYKENIEEFDCCEVMEAHWVIIVFSIIFCSCSYYPDT